MKVFVQFLTELVNPEFVWGVLAIFRENAQKMGTSGEPFTSLLKAGNGNFGFTYDL